MVTRREFLKLFRAVPALAVVPFVKLPESTAYTLSGDAKVQGGKWHHYSVTGSDNLTLYIDGKQVDKAGHPIRPGDILVRRDDGLLYPFNHPHPFAGIATSPARAGECVEYVEARQ